MGKTLLLTGAAGGIGGAIAELFAQHGYNLVLNYYRSRERAFALQEALQRYGIKALSYQANVADRRAVDEMVDFCFRTFGTIDVLINNAGVAQDKLFTDITQEDWDTVIDVNLKGVFNCSQSVLRYMLPRKAGKIINISSIWGMVGASCEVHYSAAKAGVIGLTKGLAKELGPSNIQVNCIAPGIIETGMLAPYSAADLAVLKENTPLLRLGKPQDVAALALFLASDQADFITGQVISPNGGFVI